MSHTREVGGALGAYSRKRVIRTSIVQGFAQLGSDLLVDFDLMMTIPLLGPFFLTMTQLDAVGPPLPHAGVLSVLGGRERSGVIHYSRRHHAAARGRRHDAGWRARGGGFQYTIHNIATQ